MPGVDKHLLKGPGPSCINMYVDSILKLRMLKAENLFDAYTYSDY